MIKQNAKRTKAILNSSIQQTCNNKSCYVFNSKTDFTRKRKVSFEDVLRIILSFGSKTLGAELDNYFDWHRPFTKSAFIQQRDKIKYSAFKNIFSLFTKEALKKPKTYKGYRLLAVDGTDLSFQTSRKDPRSYQKKPCALMHVNAMYDLMNNVYTDAVVTSRTKAAEVKSAVEMVENCSFASSAILIADRGYGSYHLFSHCDRNDMKYLVRIKDINSRTSIVSPFNYPDKAFDVTETLTLTRKQSLYLSSDRVYTRFIPSHSSFDYISSSEDSDYVITIRFVRFRISEDCYETIATNLSRDEFTPEDIKKLYSLRWREETGFRQLKHIAGMYSVHSSKDNAVKQEIFACLTLFNFTSIIAVCVRIKKKYRYDMKINFRNAFDVCKAFFLARAKSPPKNIEALLLYDLVPVRNNRKYPRPSSVKGAKSFNYRIS